MATSKRHLTAMARAEPSRPIRLAVEHGIVKRGSKLLDHGCGRGADVDWLSELGVSARGWDPVHRPNTRRTKSEVVTSTYVVNVIERPSERDRALAEAWALTTKTLIVSARLEDERDESHVKPFADGWMTSRGTFQKFFKHGELGEWVEAVTGVEPVAAAPGMYYVFRRRSDREAFASRRYLYRSPAPHVRKSDALFVEHRELLQTVIDFFVLHGRLPTDGEAERADDLIAAFGSIGRAFRVIEVVTAREEWLALAERRRIDLLVYLALRFLDGPYKMSHLNPETQRDVRIHYKSLTNAKKLAERLLFAVGQLENIALACRSSLVGKQMPSALYVHRDAFSHVPAVLKVYEACARRVIGDVPGANIIKLHRDAKKVSYLSYPDFDTDPHPGLVRSDVVDLVEQSHKVQRYRPDGNVPILHRKEEFLHPSDQRWEPFSEVTKREVAAGLHNDPLRIGRRDQWIRIGDESPCRDNHT